MKLYTLMIITAIIALIFGLGFILVPVSVVWPVREHPGRCGCVHRALPGCSAAGPLVPGLVNAQGNR